MPHRHLTCPVVLIGLALAGCAAPRQNCLPSDLATKKLREVTSPDETPPYDPDLMAALGDVMRKSQANKPDPKQKPQTTWPRAAESTALPVGVSGWTNPTSGRQFTGISTAPDRTCLPRAGTTRSFAIRFRCNPIYRSRARCRCSRLAGDRRTAQA